jgi:hypothetical protein
VLIHISISEVSVELVKAFDGLLFEQDHIVDVVSDELFGIVERLSEVPAAGVEVTDLREVAVNDFVGLDVRLVVVKHDDGLEVGVGIAQNLLHVGDGRDVVAGEGHQEVVHINLGLFRFVLVGGDDFLPQRLIKAFGDDDKAMENDEVSHDDVVNELSLPRQGRATNQNMMGMLEEARVPLEVLSFFGVLELNGLELNKSASGCLRFGRHLFKKQNFYFQRKIKCLRSD